MKNCLYCEDDKFCRKGYIGSGCANSEEHICDPNKLDCEFKINGYLLNLLEHVYEQSNSAMKNYICDALRNININIK